jgi:hypothetical protein
MIFSASAAADEKWLESSYPHIADEIICDYDHALCAAFDDIAERIVTAAADKVRKIDVEHLREVMVWIVEDRIRERWEPKLAELQQAVAGAGKPSLAIVK